METGFYNTNANRSYPFITTATVNAAVPEAILVDAGFRLGPQSRFVQGTDEVYLAGIRRTGDWFYLDFASNAPELYGVLLTFSRHVSDDDYMFEESDSGREGLSESSLSVGSISEGFCDEPLWSGFIVTGKVASLEAFLPADGAISFDPATAVVEPGLVQSLAGGYVTKLAIANDDRTRVQAAEDCDPITFDFETGLVYVASRCMLGEIVFRSGFNCLVTQSSDNAIVLDGIVGAGAGEPCAVEPLFQQETPPFGSNLFEGGPQCNEVLRSINGVGGRQFSIVAGTGVNVTSVPESNKLILTVDMSGLALCFDTLSRVSESC